MPTREILRDQWVAFFDSFSRQHAGSLITIEILTSQLGAHRQLREKPLIGISADLKSSSDAIISIAAGDRADDYIDHIINGASRVGLEETQEGVHKGLRITAEDGEMTLLRLRLPALPGNLDGGLG
jgi:hypothetical protein